MRALAMLAVVMCSMPIYAQTSDRTPPSYPSFGYEVARVHEIKPHRRTVPIDGVKPGFN